MEKNHNHQEKPFLISSNFFLNDFFYEENTSLINK